MRLAGDYQLRGSCCGTRRDSGHIASGHIAPQARRPCAWNPVGSPPPGGCGGVVKCLPSARLSWRRKKIFVEKKGCTNTHTCLFGQNVLKSRRGPGPALRLVRLRHVASPPSCAQRTWLDREHATARTGRSVRRLRSRRRSPPHCELGCLNAARPAGLCASPPRTASIRSCSNKQQR